MIKIISIFAIVLFAAVMLPLHACVWLAGYVAQVIFTVLQIWGGCHDAEGI